MWEASVFRKHRGVLGRVNGVVSKSGSTTIMVHSENVMMAPIIQERRGDDR
jgi:hypothetical protein